jgi:aspartyl-tRNA(Asn)/glutamyl-tRNA(Gln) amidotransferase subunit A
MIELTITAASDLLRQKKLSPVELTTACLNRIEQLNPILNAFITVASEAALAEARTAEHEIYNGNWRGPLHGIPIGLKDLLDTSGVKTTCASALFADRIPNEDAEVVRRLKSAGAVIVGKQNMQEFAYGGTSAASYYGPVRNPWDVTRTPGGSSGGSAAAVAAGMCLGAIGSDTGGSIRQPASYCSVVGLKPTYGLVSTRGAFPLAWSLDHLGPITRTVADAAIMLEAIAGYDELDLTSVDVPPETYAKELNPRDRLRIGLVERPYFEELHPDVQSAMDEAMRTLQQLGVEVRDVEIPDAPTTVLGPEAYAVHAKYLASSSDSYQRWTRERLEAAGKVSTVAYVEGRRELDRVRRVVNDVFSKVDLIITPTVPVPPITVDQATTMSQPAPPGEIWLRNTRPFNAHGLPAISIPCGFTKDGLPIGLQIAGPHFGEARVLSLAHAFEEATEWHQRVPKLD